MSNLLSAIGSLCLNIQNFCEGYGKPLKNRGVLMDI